MKKLLSLVLFGLMFSNPIFGTTNQPNISDKTQLQEAIDALAYPNKNQPFDEFLKDFCKHYSTFQHDCLEMQNQVSELEKKMLKLFNKRITMMLSNLDEIKMIYIINKQKLNSVEDITPELMELTQKAFQKTLFSQEYCYLAEKEHLFASLKFKQQQRESFYTMLLTKPEIKREYDDIISGKRNNVSYIFIKEMISSTTSSMIVQIKELMLRQLDGAPEETKAQILKALPTLDQEMDPYKLLNDITKKIPMLKILMPLLIKHFGNIALLVF